jgi:RNA-directed DNA polymerase
MNTLDLDFNYPKQAVTLLECKLPRDLAKLLHISYPLLIQIVSNPKYKEFRIPKKTGGYREISAPDFRLAHIQKRLNYHLQAVYEGHNTGVSHGFVRSFYKNVPTKNIVSNAANHIGQHQLLNIDIKDFFHSISASRVREMFMTFPFEFSRELATCLALICCFEKRLPMGAATSPVIANLVCLDLDNELIEFANKKNITYSRYADDLTFSSSKTVEQDKVDDILLILKSHQFEPNPKKIRINSRYSKQTVTGILVNEKLNVDRRYIRKIRAILHDIKVNGIELATHKHYKQKVTDALVLKFQKSINSKINFIGDVRGKSDAVYNKLKQELDTLIVEIY